MFLGEISRAEAPDPIAPLESAVGMGSIPPDQTGMGRQKLAVSAFMAFLRDYRESDFLSMEIRPTRRFGASGA
jgi:hypothetical protein